MLTSNVHNSTLKVEQMKSWNFNLSGVLYSFELFNCHLFNCSTCNFKSSKLKVDMLKSIGTGALSVGPAGLVPGLCCRVPALGPTGANDSDEVTML